MKFRIEITSDDVKKLIVAHIQSLLGSIVLDESNVRLEVKSKLNYRAEWEPALFRAFYEHE